MTETIKVPLPSAAEEAEEDLLDAFDAAYVAWTRSKSTADEAEMLRAAVPVLRLMADQAKGPRYWLLGTIATALHDRLDGWGWESLTTKRSGRGTNFLQAKAKRMAWVYINSVRAGVIDDIDPLRTVCQIYHRSEKQIMRWKRYASSELFPSNTTLAKSTIKEMALSVLRYHAQYVNRKAQDTSP